MIQNKKVLSETKAKNLIFILEKRFNENRSRHSNVEWKSVFNKLNAAPDKLWSLNEMELSGGEPDVVKYDKDEEMFYFYDTSEESPKDRRSLCYDIKALDSRKKNKPENNVIDVCMEMGVELLSESEYRFLQTLGEFDLKTSSWIMTPDKIRSLGGALFCDYRYDTVFVYHNGADSYYASRGFRTSLKV